MEFFPQSFRSRVGRLALALSATLLAPLASGSIWVAVALDPGTALNQYGHDVWKDGLPQATVLNIVQTRDGYIWFGTYEGLVRFNGVGFTVFDRANTPALENHRISALFEDGDGTLWIGSAAGSIVTYRDGQFTDMAPEEREARGLITFISQDRQAGIWIGTQTGLLLRFQDQIFTKFAAEQGFVSKQVNALCTDREGTVWIGTNEGLIRYRDGEFTPMAGRDALSSDTVDSLAVDESGALWIGTHSSGLQRLKDGLVATYTQKDGLGSDQISRLFVDRHQTVWIGTSAHGLNRFRDGQFSSFTERDGLTQSQIYALCEDHEGSLWIGTNGGGLNRLKDGKLISLTPRHGLSAANTRVVFEGADGTIWIGTDGGGLNRLKDGRITAFTKKDGLPSELIRALCMDRQGTLWIGTHGGGLSKYQNGAFTTISTREGLGGNEVRTVLEDRSGAIWVGLQGRGLDRIQDGKITHFTTENGLLGNDVRALFEDRAGNLWIGCQSVGMSRYRDGVFTNFTSREGLGAGGVFAVYEDANGNLWFGTGGGGLTLYRDGVMTVFTTRDGLLDDAMFRILEDDAGNLWMSSNKGIYTVSTRELFDRAEGRIDRVRGVSFSKADGMPSNQCNGTSQPAGWKTRDGRLWFPTIGGLAVIDPRHITNNALAPPVVVHQVLVDGRSLGPARPASVAAGSEKFEFHYDGLSFLVPERVRFRYKLEGFDRDWIDADTRRVAYYTNLSAGGYTFRVQACNNDGVWNETGAKVSLELPPRPWRTWWAYGLYAGAFLVLGSAGMRLRVRALKRRTRELEDRIAKRTAELAEKLQELETSEHRALESEQRAHESERKSHESEQRALKLAEAALDANKAKSAFLSNMSHELRTPLNAVLGFAQLLTRDSNLAAEQRQNVEIIVRSGEHLLGLINDVLSIAKIEAGKLSLSEQPFALPHLLRAVEEMFRVRAEAKGLDVHFDIAPSLPQYVLGDEGKLRQVLLNLLGNAVKFTRIGTVSLTAGWHQGRASFQVKDTGPGIAEDELAHLFEPFVQAESGRKAREGTGLGLVISRQIVRLMGGDITVDSRLGEGTSFCFQIALPEAEAVEVRPERGQVIGIEAGQPVPRVLVVDDVMENRLLLSRLLVSVGVQVREAEHGEQALEIWKAWAPQLIWMDMRMPVLDGYEATRRIRSEQGTGAASGPHPPVIIALTASVFEHDRTQIVAAGCDDIVIKPFASEEIFSKMEEHLGLRFVYERVRQEAAAASQSVLTVERMSRVPAGHIAALDAALSVGDDEAALGAIAEIRGVDEALAQELESAVRQFQFNELISLLERLHATSAE